MIYKLLKAMIRAHRIEGMEEKIDVFYACSKITEAEREDLMELLQEAQGE